MILRCTVAKLSPLYVVRSFLKFPVRPEEIRILPLIQITVPVRTISIYERNIHGYEFEPDVTPEEIAKELWSHGWNESKLFWEEVKEYFLFDPKMFTHGDTDKIFKFDSEECLKKWRTAYDKKFNQGFSECSLIINNQRKGVFSGTIDTTLPKDGKVIRAGYCAMKSKKLTKSFSRPDHYQWDPFTHLEMRVRGDGRTYAVHLGMGYYFDTMWLDLYTYYIYTRGGPYWQTIRIPFSKFFLSSKSRLQDKQAPFPKHKVDSVGILCANTPGPFKLEIDYIGVHRDLSEKERFAYEQYNIPKYYVSGE